MLSKALIVVDLQNDFCPGGALAVPRGDEVIEVANRMTEHFGLVVATQDWHPPGHLSFAASHQGRQPGEVIDLAGLEQVLWPVHCVQDTPGAALVAALERQPAFTVFRKGMNPEIDSYSAFYDNGHRQGTGLTGFLRERGVQDLYLMGLATDYCVKFTALDALRDGFEVFLIEDGCRGVELADGDVDAAVAEMRSRGVAVIHSGQIAP